MNGMDAVALATGQDWRAIEAGAHAFAALTGTYQPLTAYELCEAEANADDSAAPSEGAVLLGRIRLPLAVGTTGGALQTHPLYKATLGLLGNPNAQQLAGVRCPQTPTCCSLTH